jgi:hypothetical protein
MRIVQPVSKIRLPQLRTNAQEHSSDCSQYCQGTWKNGVPFRTIANRKKVTNNVEARRQFASRPKNGIR